MVAIGYSTLKRNAALAALLAASVSSCASVDQTSKTQLSAVQTVVPITKPGTEVGYATASAETATGAATPTAATETSTGMVVTAAAIDQKGATTTTSAVTPLAATTTAASTETMKSLAAATPVTTTTETTAVNAAVANKDATPTSTTLAQSMTDSYAAMPLTDEVTAIQSVIPMKRPTTELAYAATPSMTVTSMNSLMDFDTRPAAVIETSVAPLPSADYADETSTKGPLRQLISKYAKLYEVPEALVHRVVKRESTYNPRAYAHGNYGLMQIRYNTARAMGYDGPASGLFDAETNLKYAVKYLRGAWITADTNHDGAVKLYSTGYYYTAKRKGLLNQVQ